MNVDLNKVKLILKRIINFDFGSNSVNRLYASTFFILSCLVLIVSFFFNESTEAFKSLHALKDLLILFAYIISSNVK